MSTKKYCYAIVEKENGKMAIIQGTLPIYWDHDVAKDRASGFTSKIVHRISISDIEKLILRTPINNQTNGKQ